MSPPLHGLRVVELTTMITGPLTGMMLADLGADVIKVENPEGGDPFRSFRGGLYSPHFCGYNRNKKSIALDLRTEFGLLALEKLIRTSDVLLENFRPGVLDRLTFDDQRIRQINPDIIHCSITGFGPTGPYAERPAYDAIAQALSGMSSLFLEPSDPSISGPTIADNITAHVACQGVLAALLGRGRDGVSRRVEINMLDATVAFMPDPFGYLHQMGMVSDMHLRAHTSQSYAFECSDRKLIAIHLSSQEKFWRSFVEVLNRIDLFNDPRFETRMSRIENYEGLRQAVTLEFGKRTRTEWSELFSDAGVPVAPIYDVTEVGSDPQIIHLNTFFRLSHATEGTITAIRRPIRFDGQREDQPAVAPPTLGEHTDEILEYLGLAVPGNRRGESGHVPFSTTN
jgi:crotonobetainyl-CoA:carnitine CoA-transferase CaiB-like acyl-CoA transferase